MSRKIVTVCWQCTICGGEYKTRREATKCQRQGRAKLEFARGETVELAIKGPTLWRAASRREVSVHPGERVVVVSYDYPHGVGSGWVGDYHYPPPLYWIAVMGPYGIENIRVARNCLKKIEQKQEG